MIRLVIVNPYSGNRRGEKYAKTVKKIFVDLKKEYDIVYDDIYVEFTEYNGHATEIVLDYDAKFKNEQIVVYVIGGDGTLSEVVTAINGKDNISMVVIPKGTGNDFARCVNSYRSMRKIIKASIENKPERVDSILVNKKVAVNMINAGLDAAIAANLDRFRKIPLITGKMKYKLAIFYTVFLPKSYKLKIRISERVIKGKFTLIAIGNNRCCGGGIDMIPKADIQDGLLDICIVKSVNLIQKLMYLPKIMKGKHENLKVVELSKGKIISVSSNKKFPVSIDGELTFIKGFRAKVSEKTLSVIKTLDKQCKIR